MSSNGRPCEVIRADGERCEQPENDLGDSDCELCGKVICNAHTRRAKAPIGHGSFEIKTLCSKCHRSAPYEYWRSWYLEIIKRADD